MDRGVKACGVKRIRIHDLRHSHVSLLINMGFSVLAIGNRFGHESEKITYRYAHLFPSVQDDMAEAIYGYVTTCRRYVGKQTNSRKLQWIERVEPEEDFLENILKGKNKGQNAAKEALVEASRVSVNKSLLLLKQNANNPDKQKQLINQLRIVFNTSGALLDIIENELLNE